MGMRILFIHGLASSGRYKMADQLRILMKGAEVLSPDVPAAPGEALGFLEGICADFRPDLIVGHSLGGFWAQKLRGWRKALVNPCFYISDFLRGMKGEVRWLSPRADGAETFTVTEAMCKDFEAVEKTEFDGLTQAEKDLTIAFFATEDETVRHAAYFERYYGKSGISFPGGHQPDYPRMRDYVVPAIKKFMK